MPTYIGLVKLTDQGIRNVKETTKRAKSFREMAEKAGVKAREILWTMGRYDIVLVVDAPNDETMSRLALALDDDGKRQDGDTQGLFGSGDATRSSRGFRRGKDDGEKRRDTRVEQ